MTGRAIALGIIIAVGLFVFMLYDGWFMKGDPIEDAPESELAE